MNKQNNWKIVCYCGFSAIALFFVSYFLLEKISNDTWRIFLITLVSAGATALLANVLWEVIAKYTFALQIRKLIGISNNIDQSGIETVYFNFLRINWEEELENAKSLDVVFVYGSTWRESNRDVLEKFIKSGGTISFYVPNPDIDEYMEEFDRRFSFLPDQKGETKSRIFDCIHNSLDMGAKVYVFDHSLQASYYRINDACYMSFFNHKKPEKGIVPAIKANKGGEFFNYISGEIDTIKSQSKEVITCIIDKELLRFQKEVK